MNCSPNFPEKVLSEEMFPKVKIKRCLKSPLFMATIVFWVILLLYTHQTGVRSSRRRQKQHSTTRVFLSPALEHKIERTCPLPEATEHDLFMLKTREEIHVAPSAASDNKIICDITGMCDRFSYNIVCRTSECSRFRIEFNLNRSHKSNVSMVLLERVVYDQIFNDSMRGNFQSKMKVACDVVNPYKLSLEVIYTKNKYCHDDGHQFQTPFPYFAQRQFNIRVFYFRHISRNELISRFTNVASIHLSMINEKVEVMDFKRVQSLQWQDADTLRMLLSGNSLDEDFSWLSDQVCLNIVDFACNMSIPRSRLMKRFISSVTSPCRQVLSLASEDNSSQNSPRRFCQRILQDKSKSDISYYYDLQSAFAVAHIPNAVATPIITMSMVDIAEIRPNHINLLDKALANTVSELLAKQDSIVIFVSDTGDYSTSQLTSKQFFQTQSSNPFLYLLCPKRLRLSLGEDLISILKLNSNRMVTPLDIHLTLRSLVSMSTGQGSQRNTAKQHSGTLQGYSLIDASMPSRSCSNFTIAPPSLCICENNFMSYPSDTHQVAFAEFAVGFLNKQLQHPSVRKYTCIVMGGISFTNVRIGHVLGKRRLKMDLVVTLNRTLYRLTNFELEMHGNQSTNKLSVRVMDKSGKYEHITYVLRAKYCSRMSKFRISNYDINVINFTGFGVEPDITRLHQHCLILVTRNFNESVTYLICNFCNHRRYRINFNISLVNMVSTVSLPVRLKLNPGEIQYLTSIVKVAYNVNYFTYKYNYDYSFDTL